MKFFRRSKPPMFDWERGPFNPMNGHSFMCECFPCVVFWDSTLGGILFEEWRSTKRRYGIPPQRKSSIGG